jgi:hypothetical protein
MFFTASSYLGGSFEGMKNGFDFALAILVFPSTGDDGTEIALKTKVMIVHNFIIKMCYG